MPGAREAALKVLERCRRDGAWSGQILDDRLRGGELSDRDAALAVHLSLGVLQNSRFLDYYIDRFCASAKLEPKVRDVLRLGAYQILFLDRIPPRAAVSESVELCRSSGHARASGLVNAVLRRLAEHRDSLPEIPGRGTGAYLAIRHSQSDWLAETLIAQRGYDFTEEFFNACNEQPGTDLQINTLKIDRESFLRLLTERDISFEIPPFPEDCVSVRGGRVTDLPGYREGLFYVQDRAAAMAVALAGPKPGMRVLDACAAPGGKSLAASIRMRGSGSVVSCDIHGKKLNLLRESAERLGVTCISTQVKDAAQPDENWFGVFDLVIADVPCSGFGVMRKKPEIRLKSREEISRLPALQLKILNNLSRYVAPGGTLLYSTCTVLREENEEVVNCFLSDHQDYAPVDFRVGERKSMRGCYTFWPQLDGSDGFFAAKLKRES